MGPHRVWMTVAIHLSAAATLSAQPWVPLKGEGTLSVTYQNYYVIGHFNVQGDENTNGATHAKALIAEIDFGLTDTIGLTVHLPFVATKYTGPAEYFVGGVPTHPGPLDDGKYHGALQDLRIEARRMWSARSVAVTPFAAGSIPTHDYETRGEAVPGRHRRELQIGAMAGADLNRIVPRTYVHGRYSLAAAERQQGFSSVRSNIDLEGGYEASALIGLRGLAAWQIAHKGPTIAQLAAHDWLSHDRFIVSSYFNLGGGIGVSLTRRSELYAVWVATISGRSGAHRGRMLAIGTSWSFGSSLNGFEGLTAVTDEPSR